MIKNLFPLLKRFRHILGLLIGVLILLTLAYQVGRLGDSSKVGLASVRSTNELVVLTRNAPTTYYVDEADQQGGLEYELTRDFAATLRVPVRYVIKETLDELFTALEQGEGHLIAAGVTPTEHRDKRFRFGESYKTVQEQVVCNRNSKIPADAKELLGRQLLVVEGSSYIESLTELQKQIPQLQWKVTDEHDTEELLRSVASGTLDCTVADSNIVAINRRYFPELAIAFPISEQQGLAWAMHPDAVDLAKQVNRFIENIDENGHLAAIIERYYGHADIFDYVDIEVFRRRIPERLQPLRKHFEAAALKYQLPWTLLAAQAYQESHWNPTAKSPTGVRGLMMLTKSTAKAMGVKDRLNPQQSIEGGAKYLSQQRNRMAKHVANPEEQLWQALAAYNIGMGHLTDARLLATRQGKNPNHWHELKEVLPLLSQKQYYRHLKHGYARGHEPVRYVQRLREYRNVLEYELNSGS